MKKIVWIVLTPLLVLLVVGLILHFGRQPQPFPEGSKSAALLQPGPMPISDYAVHLIDRSRPTDANGNYAGAPERDLEGMVWYPSSKAEGPYPLIVYSHGFTSDWHEGIYLAEHLSSLGYVVVAVNFPLSNLRSPGGPTVRDVVNQPGDVSFIINTLLHQNQTPGHALEGMIDEKRIGVVGLSLGGMTTELVTFHPTLRDPRIAAALSIAGPTSMFTRDFFATTSVPFLMLAGDMDALIPYASNAAPVPAKINGAALVTIAGGSHTGFAGPAAPLRWLVNPDELGCFVVMRNINVAETQSWFKRIGTPEQGVDYTAKNELCQVNPLPQAMNVLRQQMITSVVVSSFFQSVFAPQPEQRSAALKFLRDVLPSEVPDVRVQM
jgi:predicted dienelactone hydrolase